MRCPPIVGVLCIVFLSFSLPSSYNLLITGNSQLAENCFSGNNVCLLNGGGAQDDNNPSSSYIVMWLLKFFI